MWPPFSSSSWNFYCYVVSTEKILVRKVFLKFIVLYYYFRCKGLSCSKQLIKVTWRFLLSNELAFFQLAAIQKAAQLRFVLFFFVEQWRCRHADRHIISSFFSLLLGSAAMVAVDHRQPGGHCKHVILLWVVCQLWSWLISFMSVSNFYGSHSLVYARKLFLFL